MKQLIALVIGLMALGVTEVIAQKKYNIIGTNKDEIATEQEIDFSLKKNVPKYVADKPHILAALVQHGEYLLSSRKLPGRYENCFLLFISRERAEMLYLDGESISYNSAVPREGEAEIAWWNICWVLAIVITSISWLLIESEDFFFYLGFCATGFLMTGVFEAGILMFGWTGAGMLTLILGFATGLLVFILFEELPQTRIISVRLILAFYVVIITVTESTYCYL